MMKKIIGRQREQEILAQLFHSQKAEFLAIYGRRRVGKTYLIRNFFKANPCFFFNSTGIFQASVELQIKQFTKEIGIAFYQRTELKEKNNWFDTFELLSDAMIKQVPENKKIVLFFDEFPWMVTHRSKLLEALEYYWNRYWSEDSRIKLIICGSAATWIIKNIINNKGGLHNRLTSIIQLDPMNLKEVSDFVNYLGVKLNNHHILQLYMVTGGIPYYLSHINIVSSAPKIIEELAFTKNSFFLKEFDNLFASLFDDVDIYIELIRTIAKKRYGMSQKELFEETDKWSRGGAVIEKLKGLERTGFIISFKPYQHQKKGIYYRVIDEYCLFYLDWIEPVKESLLIHSLQKGYWQQMQKTPSWRSWAGYAFESVCYKHLGQISKTLSLSPTALPSAWRYTPRKKSNESGAQIDLLFDRDDNAITLCEIKYTEQPFAIDKEYAEKLRKKVEIFKTVTRARKQIFISMICAIGLKKTMYSEEMVNGVVTLEDLFMEVD